MWVRSSRYGYDRRPSTPTLGTDKRGQSLNGKEHGTVTLTPTPLSVYVVRGGLSSTRGSLSGRRGCPAGGHDPGSGKSFVLGKEVRRLLTLGRTVRVKNTAPGRGLCPGPPSYPRRRSDVPPETGPGTEGASGGVRTPETGSR